MDATDSDWKKNVGFPINYDSGQSSDDEFKDVVMRHPRRSSRFLLADGGDGAEADLLGTTPPRSRIRDKEKRRSHMDVNSVGFQRMLKKEHVDQPTTDQISPVNERLKKRSSLKLIRSKERDWKLDMSQRDPKADSLPSPNPTPAVPTLVESCNRFMSLSSRLKCPATDADKSDELVEQRWRDQDEELPPSRVNFHKTFSMLINMGNIDKGCKRTGALQISREEQVWQNELKDLIWLELQATLAGRSLAHQDAQLCAQRAAVPALLNNIIQYRFVNDNPCRGQPRPPDDTQVPREDVSPNHQGDKDFGKEGDDDAAYGCLTFECGVCAAAVGRGLREVGGLLDAFYNAVSLYPSTKAMTLEHPIVATQLFKNRLKAMCLWYNTALNMRLKMVSLRRVLRALRLRCRPRPRPHPDRPLSTDSDASRESSENHRVQFNVSNNPTDSSNSDSSTLSEAIKEESEKDLGEWATVDKEKEKEMASEGGTKDEVDSGECASQTGQITPEIVISDSRYGTSDTIASNESGYSSESGVWSAAGPSDAFDLGPLHDLTQLSLLNKCSVSLYREHHREILKTQGVRRCMMFVSKMRTNILHKGYLTLEKPDSFNTENETEDDPAEVFEDSRNYEDKEGEQDDDEVRKTYELRRYGWWSEECQTMRLPSYRSHFLLLSSICMEAVHDYLTFRLETRPEQPSCLTIKQLIHELKEGLDISTEMRADFVRNLRAALAARAPGPAAADLLLLVRTFDATVETVLQLYLSYLRTMSLKEQLGRASLQAEWTFTARLAKRVRCAADLAPATFANIACNQLNKLLKQYEDKFAQLMEDEDIDKTDSNSPARRHTVYALCRAAQGIFAGEREATLHAAHWARALAARLARAPPPAHRTLRGDIFNALMSIRDFIVKQVETILEHSKSPPAEEILSQEHPDAVMTRVRELLLQVCKLGFELHKELYKVAQAPFQLLEERRALRRRRPASLQPPRAPPPPPSPRRRPGTVLVHHSFNPLLIHKELHRFVNEPALSRPSLAARRSIASPPKGLARSRFTRTDSVVEDYETSVFDDRLFDLNNFGDSHTQTSIELLLSGEQAVAEQQVEPRGGGGGAGGGGGGGEVSGEEKQWAARVARAVVEFARCWMLFVVERCDRGRGLRPRWASQGLEFLMLACDPCNTKHLSDEEFEELKQLMDRCISHVIGSQAAPGAGAGAGAVQGRGAEGAAGSPSPRVRHRLHSPLSSGSTGREAPASPTPPGETDRLLFPEVEAAGRRAGVVAGVQRVDRERDSLLRAQRRVGRVLDAAVASYEPRLRQLTFKWQRGLKIGAGSFGKVYTAVNTESGQLLAMKELSIAANDRRAFQRAANELRVLEGVVHPHLVRYYGCELHREEMLIFMELCVEGSLEALVGAGALGEAAVRRYTKQLVSAVAALHARNIAHRDIKSGNIFLTNEGHCLKLGDFGCAVKIRANTTAPCELQGFVGTQAYMAPEVFMRQSGHGRAADIWSLGCVVTEMASGKRPFAEYDSNYQIMFLVGSGSRPAVPDALSAEGAEFCRACLAHDPALRPRAEALAHHSFLMVKSDDDCECEPGHLIA